MAIDVEAPSSSRGLLILLSIFALILVYIFATALGTVLLGAVVISIAAYVVFVCGGRIHDWLRHGKPLMRRGSRSGQSSDSGGDGGGR